ncbi:NAD(P)/FAD-dependent oxidoreductase [Mycetocola tolaasinivorans]|nr:FAD-dependent oxidoreductase [Mycetocola tolaasinivorans]
MSGRDGQRIAVVGAGVIGAATAYELSRAGARVLILDAGQIAGGATRDAFAWVGLAASAADMAQAALRRIASNELDRLAAELALPVALNRAGALSWSEARGKPDAQLTIDPALHAVVRIASREEVGTREPGLRTPPDSAVLAETDGSVDPVALTRALISGALANGAEFVPETRVEEILTEHGQVTGLRTSSGSIAVDTVVLAAGTGTTELAHGVGVRVPVNSSPCILLRFRTPGRLVHGIVSGPEFELRQPSDTVLLAAEDYIDNSAENGPEAVAQRALEVIRQEIVGADGILLDEIRVGQRPIPSDGRPIIGYASVSGLYVTAAHAGIALAAGIGTLAAEESLTGRRHEALETFRPTRFSD